jgi:RimJ/RimL family protein N-acetyltransferase
VFGPVIQGSSFRLRPARIEEAEAMTTWFADLEVTARVMRRYPPSLEEEQEWLRKVATDPNQIVWAIEHGGLLVGVTGIHAIDWPNQHGTTGTLIGDKKAWGKGIAGELMKLRADYAFQQTTLRKLKSGFIEGNEASRRAQMAAGYRECGRRRQEYFRDSRWLDHIDTELLREDWALKIPSPLRGGQGEGLQARRLP